MPSWNRHWMVLVTGLMVVWWVGCRGESTPDQIQPPDTPTQGQLAPDEPVTEVETTDADTTEAARTEADTSVVEATPDEEPPPPPPTIPEVLLTDAYRETCLVLVGDPMPQAELPDLAGEQQPLGELLGDKLTVVFFWTSGSTEFSQMAARMALEDLQKDVYEPYAQKGVEVIAVNEGNAPEDVKKLVDEVGVTFLNLLDSDGAYFAQVAKEKLPRPYLLDADGKILWFDLELSPITRQRLMQAIQVALGELGGT